MNCKLDRTEVWHNIPSRQGHMFGGKTPGRGQHGTDVLFWVAPYFVCTIKLSLTHSVQYSTFLLAYIYVYVSLHNFVPYYFHNSVISMTEL